MKKMHGSTGKVTGDMTLRQRNAEREGASHLGSLGDHMNQGGSYMHPSADTIPQLMNQGPRTKRGNKTHVALRELAGQ